MTLETIDGIRTTSREILEKIDNHRVGQNEFEHDDVIAEKLRSLQVALLHLLKNKKAVRPLAPVYFMRQWAFASVRKSLRKIKSAEEALAVLSSEKFLKEARFLPCGHIRRPPLFSQEVF